MLLTLILFLIGFVFLVKGADFLVDGASSIARKYGISSIVIGLTIVAFGTSLPELLVSVLASLKGTEEIALGNVIGSNISNTLLILGATALVSPLVVRKKTVNREIPFSLLAIFVVLVLVNDKILEGSLPNSLTRIDGLILLFFFAIFIYYSFAVSKEKETVLEKVEGIRKEDIKIYTNWKSIGFIAIGMVGLYFGGEWIVNGAIEIAEVLGLSQALISLTIISIGTSLPELAASIMAAKKGNADMSVGNVIGSNIFNLLWILGLSATISPIAYNTILNTDFLILLGVTIVLVPLVFAGRKNVLTKKEGFVLLSFYLAYLIYIIIRG